jgi:hypothetical protein
VGERQVCKKTVIGQKMVADESVYGAEGCYEIGVGDANAFGWTCASAGVHDACDGIFGWNSGFEGIRGLGATELAEIGDGVDLYFLTDVPNLFEKVIFRLTIIDDVFDCRCLGEDVEESGEKIGVGEESDAIGFVERVGETGFAKSIVGSSDGGGDGHARMGYELPVDTIYTR